MQVAFLKKFSKDLDKITQPKDRKALLEVIKSVKEVNKLEDVPGVKKLTASMMRLESVLVNIELEFL